MKIIASWNYSEDLDNLEKTLLKEYSRLIPKDYTVADKDNKTPLVLVKDDTDRKSGYISFLVKYGKFKQEIANKLSREKVIRLLNAGFSDYIVKNLEAITGKDGEYWNFTLEYRKRK